MCVITVQLVFAFVGTRVPYQLCESPAGVGCSPTPSPFGSTTMSNSFSATAQSSLRVQSANSSASLGPSAPKFHFTAQQLFTRLAAIAESLQCTRQSPPSEAPAQPSSGEPTSPSSAAVMHKTPLLEFFNYETLSPLDGTAVLADEDVLLVWCDAQISVELVEALQLEWLEAYSGIHKPHHAARPLTTFTPTSATEMAVCTTEERLRNVAHARLALCKTVPLHMHLLEEEFAECKAALAKQRKHLLDLKLSADTFASFNATASTTDEGAAASAVFSASTAGVADRFPLLAELEPSLTSTLSPDAVNFHSTSNESSLLMCGSQLASKQTVVMRISKQLSKLQQLSLEEEEKQKRFATGEHARALQLFLGSAEQDRGTAEAIVQRYQAEMLRQLKCVRFLVAHVTLLRNLVKKARREMAAIDLVLNRLSSSLELPRLLEQAEVLLRRRVVLRRAARRMQLLLQETEYSNLQRDLHDFSQRREVQDVLSPKVWWYLRAPLPSILPAEDVVATLLDHALIDRNVDEAQELVERIRCVSLHTASSTDAAQSMHGITDSLLPVERLLRRAEEAEAKAAAYKAQVEELELKVREYEAAKEASCKSLDTVETEAFPGNGVEENVSNPERLL
ncbi:hypothetical protein ABL78_1870 [Leptomonas seymouri]|uniref:Uncharacterized protein n=1 Tax=Leptomonas seymouri TaxID=5684 RepID=A0A0N0P7N7_LEPSE|nr:hypothetical protein ABL78_1870 [Leptomonas seymouri]|eukprot:KPI88986.1 hypothetical protein ABL78_1870 [Leptomonas seymouri]